MAPPSSPPGEGCRIPPPVRRGRVRPRAPLGLWLLILLAIPLLLPSVGDAAHPSLPSIPSTPTEAASHEVPTQARSLPTSPFSASLHRPLERVLSVADEALRPSATISTSNLTGFIASGIGLTTLLSNQGADFSMAVPPPPPGFSGGGTTDIIVGLAGEDLNSTVSALVGFAETTELGQVAWVPLYLVNDSGLSIIGTGAAQIGTTGVPATFAMQETHGDWWSFTMDGQLMSAHLYGSGNGSANLGLSDASPLEAESVPIFTYMITQNLTSIPLTPVQTVLDLLSTQVWTATTTGYSLIDLNGGVAGYDQDSLIPPDSVQFGGSWPVLTIGTELWSSASLPLLSVQEHGLPAALIANQTYDFRIWTNDSSATPPTGVVATLSANETAGTTSILSSGPSPGEEEWAYQAPETSSSVPETMTLTATDANYVGAALTLDFTVSPGALSIASPHGPFHVLSDATVLLPFWVNSSGVPANPPTLTASVAGGGTITEEWLGGHATGYYAVLYTSPSFLSPSTSWVNLSASGPGFVQAATSYRLTVWPRAVSLTAPASATLSAGTTATIDVPVSSPSGVLPSAASGVSTWWNVTVTGSEVGTPLGGSPQVVLVGSDAQVLLPLSASYVGSLSVGLGLGAAGFNATSVGWEETDLGTFVVQLSTLPAQISSGSVVPLLVNVSALGAGPYQDAAVVWSVNYGTFQGPGTSTATSYSSATGSAGVSYVAPSVGQDEPLQVTVSVNAAFYTPATVWGNTTLIPSASGQSLLSLSNLGPISLLIALIVLGLVLAVLIAIEYGRQLEARHRPKPVARPRAAPKRAAPKATPALDVVAPVPGAAGAGEEPVAEEATVETPVDPPSAAEIPSKGSEAKDAETPDPSSEAQDSPGPVEAVEAENADEVEGSRPQAEVPPAVKTPEPDATSDPDLHAAGPSTADPAPPSGASASPPPKGKPKRPGRATG